MTGTTDDRLNRIEMLLAHQEKQIEELSDMTSKQWDMIDALKRRLDGAMTQIRDMELASQSGKSEGATSVSAMAAAEKPPHY